MGTPDAHRSFLSSRLGNRIFPLSRVVSAGRSGRQAPRFQNCGSLELCQFVFCPIPQLPPIGRVQLCLAVGFPVGCPTHIPRSMTIHIARHIMFSRIVILESVRRLPHVQYESVIVKFLSSRRSVFLTTTTMVIIVSVHVIGDERHENVFAIPFGFGLGKKFRPGFDNVRIFRKVATNALLHDEKLGQDDFDVAQHVARVVPVPGAVPNVVPIGASVPAHDAPRVGGKFAEQPVEGAVRDFLVVVNLQDPG
mmetsp:Transcript_5779/g.16207  ORF Transcript_5779/g.16207 Transcript_5779/m.16207 type:complete len:251 (+) Transcript_5779:2169-2921(+)